MKAKQSVDMTVSDSADPRPSYVRARNHVINFIGDSKALRHCTVEEILQWAYAREKVHLARPPGLDLGARLRPRGFAGQSSSERIGAAVGSSMNLGFEAPRDAYAVHAAVGGLAPQAAALVRTYAMIGHPPDWTPEPVVWWEQGAPIYGRRGQGQNRPPRIIGYCVYARGDLPALVEERRAVYGRWAASLAAIHKTLSDKDALVDVTLDGTLPQAAPWNC